MTTSTTRDVELTSSEQREGDASGRNVIAVIGINQYVHWSPLTHAVGDAHGTVASFRRLGFEQVTKPLLDDCATGEAIHALVRDDLRMLGPNDSLVLFFAGHGGTQEHRIEQQIVKTGYLIPVDASKEVATWIDLEGWLRAVSLLPARHILVILDACHSGIALGPIIKWRDVGAWQNTPLATLKVRRSRRIITSALDDQVALDSGPIYGHSLFAGCLIEGLTHDLTKMGYSVITGSELGMYAQRRVESYPNSRQTPDFGTFDFDERGELVIPLVINRPRESIAIEPPVIQTKKNFEPGHPTAPQFGVAGNHVASDISRASKAASMGASTAGAPSQQHLERRAMKPWRYMSLLIKIISWFGIPGISAVWFGIYMNCHRSTSSKGDSGSFFHEIQSTVTGELSVSGTREGSWKTVLSHCDSGQHLGFWGVDLTDDNKIALRVILDPSKGTQILVRWPSSDKAFELTPDTCPGLSADVHPTNTIYNDIRVLDGDISFVCPIENGGQAKVAAHFSGCR